MSNEEILDDEEWVGGYPPWWADWLINNKAAVSREEARELLLTMRAVEDGDVEEVRRRLDAGLDPNIRLFSGYDSLLQTALERSRSPEVASLLIDRGADVGGPSVLFYATQTGFEEVAEKLLKAGLDPNKKVDGKSILPGVAWGGDQRMVKLLLHYGADIDGTTTVYPTQKLKVTKVTGLMVTSWLGNLSMVNLLLTEGAQVSRKDSLGRTALDWAKQKKGKKADRIVEALDKAGAKAGSGADLGIVEVPDFRKAAMSRKFREALKTLGSLTKARPATIELEDEEMRGGYALAIADEATAKSIVADHRDELLAKGCLTFWSRDLTNGNGACVVALPTTDPYLAIAALQTAGPNSNVTTLDVIRFLRSVEPLRIKGIGVDFIEADLLDEPVDPLDLARRIIELCPDGAVDDLEAYARHLAKTRRLFLWWD